MPRRAPVRSAQAASSREAGPEASTFDLAEALAAGPVMVRPLEARWPAS
jgi:hypothetical protein